MELRVERTTKTSKSTMGNFYINGKSAYYTLEDVDRGVVKGDCSKKIKGKTCIPKGRYEVIMGWSNRFKRDMPRVQNVPCFEGILIHAGNDADNTEGCILIGMLKSVDFVGQSRIAFNDFMLRFENALLKGEKVWLTVYDEGERWEDYLDA